MLACPALLPNVCLEGFYRGPIVKLAECACLVRGVLRLWSCNFIYSITTVERGFGAGKNLFGQLYPSEILALAESSSGKELSFDPRTSRVMAQAMRDGISVSPARRKIWLSLLWQLAVFALGLMPAILIGVLASSQHRQWMKWLEQLGTAEGREHGGQQTPPAAVWRENGVADFGPIEVSDYDPVTGITRLTSFQMRVATPCQNQSDFEPFIRKLGYTIRDEVLVTVRVSSVSELSDAEFLGRKIAARLNRLLGRGTIRGVHLSDLNIVEIAPANITRTTSPSKSASPRRSPSDETSSLHDESSSQDDSLSQTQASAESKFGHSKGFSPAGGLGAG